MLGLFLFWGVPAIWRAGFSLQSFASEKEAKGFPLQSLTRGLR
jgi:hypothetical protein